MTRDRPEHSIEMAGNLLHRWPLRIQGAELMVMFTVEGPDASPRFPGEHVTFFRPGDEEKLSSRSGYGGYEADGTAFYVCRVDWPGGDMVEVWYSADQQEVLHRETVRL